MTKDIRLLSHSSLLWCMRMMVASTTSRRMIMRTFSPAGGRVSFWTDDQTEYILPALLISGLKE